MPRVCPSTVAIRCRARGQFHPSQLGGVACAAHADGWVSWPVMAVMMDFRRPAQARHCGWCGSRLPEGDKTAGKVGRPRRYCTQSCRQRAYERRAAVQRTGLPEDAVVLSAAELADLQDRLFEVRCAAEDIATAADDGAAPAELRSLAVRVASTAANLERLR